MINKVLLALVVLSLTAMALFAAPIDLTQDETVQSVGNYTYFARGNASEEAVTSFTKAFYPGGIRASDVNYPGLHANTTYGGSGRDGALEDSGSNAGAISFASGDLTDGSTSTYASGYIDTLSPDTVAGGTVSGYFDVFFDLGAVYNIDQVNITYGDRSGGPRWAGGSGTQLGYQTDAQEVWYASTLAGATPLDSDFSVLGAGTFVKDATHGIVNVAGTSTVQARYVVLHLAAQIVDAPSTSAGLIGGLLEDVQIMGSAVPEPATIGMIGIGGLVAFLARRWSR